MEEGSFELNKPGWYKVDFSEPNKFLNDKLETDQYGIWYAVKFTGSADTYLWQTKTEPVTGEKYWGWIEKTRSGKAIKFKWDKQNAPSNSGSAGQPPQNSLNSYNRNDDIVLSMVWKTLLEKLGVPPDDIGFMTFFETVKAHVDELLLMGEHMKHNAPRRPVGASHEPEEPVRSWDKLGQPDGDPGPQEY